MDYHLMWKTSEEHDALVKHIAKAARDLGIMANRLGIYTADAELTGPQVLILVDDIAREAARGMALRRSIEAMALPDVGLLRRALAESETGRDIRMAYAPQAGSGQEGE